MNIERPRPELLRGYGALGHADSLPPIHPMKVTNVFCSQYFYRYWLQFRASGFQ